MNWERIVLLCLLAAICLAGIAYLCRKMLFGNRLKAVKENVHFSTDLEARKTAFECKEIANPGKLPPKNLEERSLGFFNVGRESTDRDKSGMMMSFTAEHNLKLDTIQPTEENEPEQTDFNADADFKGGDYIDTSAKNSTKNVHRKEFFIDYRRKKGDSGKKGGQDLKTIDERTNGNKKDKDDGLPMPEEILKGEDAVPGDNNHVDYSIEEEAEADPQ